MFSNARQQNLPFLWSVGRKILETLFPKCGRYLFCILLMFVLIWYQRMEEAVNNYKNDLKLYKCKAVLQMPVETCIKSCRSIFSYLLTTSNRNMGCNLGRGIRRRCLIGDKAVMLTSFWCPNFVNRPTAMLWRKVSSFVPRNPLFIQFPGLPS